jgi:MraZ protein
MSMGCRWPNNLTLDAKQRVPGPAPYRLRALEPSDDEEGISTFYIGREKDPCLYMHSLSQHREYLNDLSDLLGGDSDEARTLMRVIRGSFVKVKSDSQGRIILSDVLRKQGGITKSVTLVDMVNRVEIWDADAFEALRDQAETSGLFDRLDELRRAREAEKRKTSGRPLGTS